MEIVKEAIAELSKDEQAATGYPAILPVYEITDTGILLAKGYTAYVQHRDALATTDGALRRQIFR